MVIMVLAKASSSLVECACRNVLQADRGVCYCRPTSFNNPSYTEHQQTHISEEVQAQIDCTILQSRRDAEKYKQKYEVRGCSLFISNNAVSILHNMHYCWHIFKLSRKKFPPRFPCCLLYTSDAADE